MDIFRKSFTGIELKADKAGHFIARIATLNAIDKDGDVTLPGAFPEGKEILISAYQHGSWTGSLPVGKGVIHEKGDEVLVEGDFNLNTTGGRDTYEAIKFAPNLQEFSYGFRVLDKEEDTEWNGNHVWRILKKVDVREASPVLEGAGMNTALLAIKSLDGLPLTEQASPVLRGAGMNTATLAVKSGDGNTYADEAEAVLAAVSSLVARTKALAALRESQGRQLSTQNLDRMNGLLKSLEGITAEIKAAIAPPVKNEEVAKLYLQYQKIVTEIGGI